MLEVHLCHLKYIIAISQEYIPSFTTVSYTHLTLPTIA